MNSVGTPNFDKMIGNPAVKQIPWDKDEERLQAWKEGKTGFPFIDAIMTQLRVEGSIEFGLVLGFSKFAAHSGLSCTVCFNRFNASFSPPGNLSGCGSGGYPISLKVGTSKHSEESKNFILTLDGAGMGFRSGEECEFESFAKIVLNP